MPCFTRIKVTLRDDDITRKARAKLGLPVTGQVSQADARRVRVEVGIMRSQATLRQISPTAVVRRAGDELTVTVSV